MRPPRLIGGGLAAIFQDSPGIADQQLGINGALFMAHNRGEGWPIFGFISARYRSD